eukprot:11193526-Lingulodinium_polyedra.AAC.1
MDTAQSLRRVPESFICVLSAQRIGVGAARDFRAVVRRAMGVRARARACVRLLLARAGLQGVAGQELRFQV